MILGRGQARSEKAIVAEYHSFLEATGGIENPEIIKRLKDAPGVLRHRIGKPLDQWRDDDLMVLYQDRTKTVRYGYSAFVAFLLFRGYRRATLRLVERFPLGFTRYHRRALQPYRQKLEQTQRELGYSPHRVGSELNLLIALLAVVHKPLAELTRPDFEGFRDSYQQWYRASQHRQASRPNSRLTRLEFYLVHWQVIPPAKVIFRHDEHFARLHHAPIRAAILAFMDWCDVKYAPSTIHSRRAALLHFFLWFQEKYPTRRCLRDVTRPVALAYAKHLKVLREEGRYSLIYCNDLYRSLRLFYEFAIRERLRTSPPRNPFALRDLPREPDPVPRYLSDHEVRAILAYCAQGASLKERTLVITLFQTGIRAAELADLKASDIVQIQGKWKLHIHEGKGLKDRLIPLTTQCLATLHLWQNTGWERTSDHLFTHHGRPWSSPAVSTIIRELGLKLGLVGLTPHRFRHTFAVALLNYGMRESALQKIMGHTTLNMTLEYARILDQTVEHAFAAAVDRMQAGPIQWMPSFFAAEDYAAFAGADAVNWICLPHGYCRRNPKLHCESDVKCLLCDRFAASAEDLPRFREMHDRFQSLGLQIKADVVTAQIRRLEAQPNASFIPLNDVVIGATIAHP
jgi:site-specific recombinase XerD